MLINGSVAGPRAAEVTYQLALCRHTEAARSQLRLDLAGTVGLKLPREAETAQKNWTAAEGYWKEFLDTSANRPGFAAAQRLCAEALVRLGRKEEAARMLRKVSPEQSGLERLGRLWLARTWGGE